MKGKCQICGTECDLTKHHLVPQVKCRNKYKSLKNDESNFIMICNLCHRTIHAYFDESTLRDRLNTLEALLSDEKFSKYADWRSKHPDFKSDSTKKSKKNR